MPLYLANILVGTGANSRNPRMAPGTGEAQLTNVLPVGARYFIWHSEPVSHPDLVLVGENKVEPMSSVMRTRLANSFAVSLDTRATLWETIADFFFDTSRSWPTVMPRRDGLRELIIAGERWAAVRGTARDDGELIDPSDDFNRADESPITTPWNVNSAGVAARIVSNELAGPSSNGDCVIYHDIGPAGVDHFSQIEIGSTAGTNNDWGAATRIHPTEFRFYMLTTWTGGGSNRAITRCVPGDFVTIANGTGSQFATGTFRMESEGSSQRAIINGGGGNDLSVTNTEITTGTEYGMFMFVNDARLDNWLAGDLGALPAAAPPRVGNQNRYINRIVRR